MNVLAEQLVCLGQRHGAEDWGDVIILVMMGLFWLVGAVVKLLSSKKTSDKKTSEHQRRQAGSGAKATPAKETWQQRLARKAREIQEAAQAERATEQPRPVARTKPAGPRPAHQRPPAGGRIAVRTDAKGDSVMVYQQPEPVQERQASAQRKAMDAVLTAGQQLLSEPVGPLDTSVASHAEPQTSDAGPQAVGVVDYGDPDALKKAILQYEILGKPLALRDPSEGFPSF